jgi:hypothetical protein
VSFADIVKGWRRRRRLEGSEFFRAKGRGVNEKVEGKNFLSFHS